MKNKIDNIIEEFYDTFEVDYESNGEVIWKIHRKDGSSYYEKFDLKFIADFIKQKLEELWKK